LSSDYYSLKEGPIIRKYFILAYSGKYITLDIIGVSRVDMEPINSEVILGFYVKHVPGLAIVFVKDSGHALFRTDAWIKLVETIIPRACVDSAGVFIVTCTVLVTFRTKGNIKGVSTEKFAYVPSALISIVTTLFGALGNLIEIGPHFCPDAVDMGSIVLVISTHGVAVRVRVCMCRIRIRKSLNARATIALEIVAEANGE
jgi:hypothetical protein